jgi:NAD(P)-dependent dehydrogenase (short-subunit alcohol dehydrogenase family)
MSKEVLVITGAGGIGQAIARRQGPGKSVLLADFNEETLQSAAKALEGAGLDVTTQLVDVSSRESVSALARAAEGLGRVAKVAHTAGQSPTMASPEAILTVDLLGTALVLEEMGNVIADGGAGVVISSMAGHRLRALAPEQDDALRNTPTDELLQLPFLTAEAVPNSTAAYEISKRANNLRVEAASLHWGDRGARVNSISPGIIVTPLAQQELDSERGPTLRGMIEASPAGRVGTADEVAAVVAFLLGGDAGFITGSDLLMDGGTVAALHGGRWEASRFAGATSAMGREQ